jgi:hypothetical protein
MGWGHKAGAHFQTSTKPAGQVEAAAVVHKFLSLLLQQMLLLPLELLLPHVSPSPTPNAQRT